MAKNKNNSLFLYTALIFIVAIIIIVLAFFGQTRIRDAQPLLSATPTAAATEVPKTPADGIVMSASQLSQENLELLNENRELNKRLDDAEEKNKNTEYLLAASGYMGAGNKDGAKKQLEMVDYDKLSDDGKLLYDSINSNLQ